MNNIETMKLALEALETNNKAWKSLADSGDAGWWEAEEQPFYEISFKAITSLRQAIEQAQQAEPFCWAQCTTAGLYVSNEPDEYYTMPLYTSPPPRQPLTDDEMKAIWYAMQNIMGWYSFQEIARAIEAAHGIKVEA